MSVDQIKTWLLSKGVTLWASWDLSQPERLQEAAEWFKAQMYDCEKFNYPNATKFMGPMMTAQQMDEVLQRRKEWDVV